ncbi:MAG: hypothetical protein NTU71_10905 [Verrucomicrobia bacterium]|nr:hypothetical protein [Verrucomicrobiota bacterium]
MRKFLLALFLLAAVGVGAWRVFAPAHAPKSPIDRLKAPSPMETVRVTKPTSPAPVVRAAPESPNKMTAQRAQMEERFTDLKEEGRRIRETLIANDPKAGQAYSTISQRPEYRQLVDQRHQIEAAWASAPDGERDAMLSRMNALRQQGIAMLLTEIQRVNSQPAGETLQRTSPGTVQLSNGQAPAPAPAPPAPIVFQ